MPSDVIEHAGGTAQPHESVPAAEPGRPPTPVARQPPIPTASTSSTDEFSLALAGLSPDPLLGAFEAGDSPSAKPGTETAPAAPTEPPRVSEAVPPVPPVTAGAAQSSSDVMAAIDLGAAPSTRARTTSETDEEEEDEEPRRGIGLGTILLMSYSSAVTIGLLWVLWTGRKARDFAETEPAASAPAPPAADASPDPGTRAGRSHKVEPKPPLAPEHIVKLGQTIKIGVLEMTPLRVTSGAVTLARIFGNLERKPGGTDALKLRLRLRNTSTDTVLAPLDEAFLRDRPGAEPDSVLEAAHNAGDAVIAMYPLALESEWSIVGQDLGDLSPGRSVETLIVSEPKALARFGRGSSDWIWRIRLRTDINHTDDLGVTFRPSDVKAEPVPKAAPKPKDRSHEVEVK